MLISSHPQKGELVCSSPTLVAAGFLKSKREAFSSSLSTPNLRKRTSRRSSEVNASCRLCKQSRQRQATHTALATPTLQPNRRSNVCQVSVLEAGVGVKVSCVPKKLECKYCNTSKRAVVPKRTCTMDRGASQMVPAEAWPRAPSNVMLGHGRPTFMELRLAGT